MYKFRKIVEIFTTAALTFITIIQALPVEETTMNSESGLLFCVTNFITGMMAHSTVIVLLLVLGIITIGTLVYDLLHESKSHVLKFKSKKFVKFFTRWYSQPGKLSLICDDLTWFDASADDKIYRALYNKALENSLTLYINQGSETNTVTLLKEAGAKVKAAPIYILQNYSFSCLSVIGNTSGVIVRDKSKDKHRYITVDEIENKHITSLLNALFM